MAVAPEIPFEEPVVEGREHPRPLVEHATRVSPHHPDRNEDKVLGVVDERLPKLAGDDPEGDTPHLKAAIEKEARCAKTLQELDVCGVLDGVSTGAGALASRMASGEIAERLAALKTLEDSRPDMTDPERVAATEQAIREAIGAAQNAVMEYKSDPGRTVFRNDLEGMSTTADIVRIVGGKAVVGHIGDGAVYLTRGGKLEKLTRDHSQAGLMKRKYGVSDAQYDTLKEAKTADPSWSDGMKEMFGLRGMFKQMDRMVYGAVGASGEGGKPDVFSIHLRPGDRLLVCSDGVSDNWKWKDLEAALAEGMTAEQFMDATVGRMEKTDDISFDMIEYPAEESGFVFENDAEESGVLDPEDVGMILEEDEKQLEEAREEIEELDEDDIEIIPEPPAVPGLR